MNRYVASLLLLLAFARLWLRATATSLPALFTYNAAAWLSATTRVLGPSECDQAYGRIRNPKRGILRDSDE